MTRERAHIERVDPAEYMELHEQRLSQDDLIEHQPMSLLVRSQGELFRAYRLTATVEQIRRGISQTALRTVMLNADFHPASARIRSRVDERNDWHSDAFSVQDSGIIVPTRTGFFATRQPDDYDYLLLQAEAEREAERHLAA